MDPAMSPSAGERRRFALLIDSDNISAKYIDAIINEITTKYGDFSYKRIYGDWTNQQNSSWKNVLMSYSLRPIQQFRNTVGKNATDSTLIIDAMDILYAGNVDGFCIVSSDSDFTSLAQRLGESGMVVIGMGEKKTPPSFRNACTQFIMLENLLDIDTEPDPETESDAAHRNEASGNILKRSAVQTTIEEILRDDESRGYRTNLADLGNRMISRYPDFDVRAFGYSQLSKFLKSFDSFELTPPDAPLYVELRKNLVPADDVRQLVAGTVRKSGDDGCDPAYLGQLIKKRYPAFSVKDLGYTKLSNFLNEIPGIELVRDVDGHKRYYAAD